MIFPHRTHFLSVPRQQNQYLKINCGKKPGCREAWPSPCAGRLDLRSVEPYSWKDDQSAVRSVDQGRRTGRGR